MCDVYNTNIADEYFNYILMYVTAFYYILGDAANNKKTTTW